MKLPVIVVSPEVELQIRRTFACFAVAPIAAGPMLIAVHGAGPVALVTHLALMTGVWYPPGSVVPQYGFSHVVRLHAPIECAWDVEIDGVSFGFDATDRTFFVDCAGEVISISFLGPPPEAHAYENNRKSKTIDRQRQAGSAEISPVVIGYLPEEMVHPPPAEGAGAR
jgi:hypothetical protein